MSDQNKHDEQLKDWINQVHQDVEIPDGKDSWLKVKSRLDATKKRRRWVKRLQIGSAIACASLLLSFALSLDMPKAYSQFSGLFKKVQENIVNIFFQEPDTVNDKNSKAKTPPPPTSNANESIEGLRIENISLEEAKEKVLFHLETPAYIPKGYELDIVTIYQDADGEYRTVFMEYVNGDGRIIQLNQRMLRDISSPEISTVHQTSTIKDIIVNGSPGVMIKHDNDFNQLEWLTEEGIKLSIFGHLPEKELISMAESLRKEK